MTDDSFTTHAALGLTLAQMNYLDGLRISAAIARSASETLHARLSEVSLSFLTQAQQQAPLFPALGDVWQVIDCVNRVRDLASAFPGVKKRAFPWAEAFIRKTDSVEELRNIIQHLASDIPTIAAYHERAWGTLEWLYVTTGSPPTINSFCFVPGWIGGGPQGITAELFDEPPLGISRICLKARGLQVTIDSLASDLASLWSMFEEVLAKRPDGRPKLDSDPLFHVKAWVKAREPGPT